MSCVVSHSHLAAGVLHLHAHTSRITEILSVFEIPLLTSGHFCFLGLAEVWAQLWGQRSQSCLCLKYFCSPQRFFFFAFWGPAEVWAPLLGSLGAEFSARTTQLLGAHASRSDTALTFVLPF